ncbi:MAG: shikimate dehydrogenase [Bacillota bacterium]|nr:shikimate dehydrogenase [Bacillota bacterium]MDW7683222.1 shikimate dehydrogenase [Bacillota bacterium]
MITGQTKITGIFGDPVQYSLSPAMHNAAFKHLKLPYIYIPFHVTPQNIQAAVSAIHALNITGVNVTVPHKEAVIPYLDVLDTSAKECGAVNTIVNHNGKLTGYNTDGSGFIDSLRETGFDPKDKKAVILGAGGSARAIAASLLNEGVAEITVLNRTPQKAEALAKALIEPQKVKVQKLIPGDAPDISGTSLIINTLSVPFKQKGGEWLLDLSKSAGALFYDLRYGKMPSDFLTLAKGLKSPGQDGLGMLLYQGVRAFRLFTGVNAPVDVMRKELKR